jgi:hypothetical protein
VYIRVYALLLSRVVILNNKKRSCSRTQQIMMCWCSSYYIRCNILDLLHVSTRMEPSSGSELKEKIYLLDIESGFLFVCLCVCVVVERSHYFFTSPFWFCWLVMFMFFFGGGLAVFAYLFTSLLLLMLWYQNTEWPKKCIHSLLYILHVKVYTFLGHSVYVYIFLSNQLLTNDVRPGFESFFIRIRWFTDGKYRHFCFCASCLFYLYIWMSRCKPSVLCAKAVTISSFGVWEVTAYTCVRFALLPVSYLGSYFTRRLCR